MAFDKSQIMNLSNEEKRNLAFELLDSIDEEIVNQPLPAWKEALIRKRIEKDKQADTEVVPWSELRETYKR